MPQRKNTNATQKAAPPTGQNSQKGRQKREAADASQAAGLTLRWTEVSATSASNAYIPKSKRTETRLNAFQLSSVIPINHLVLSKNQRDEIDVIYASNHRIDRDFAANSLETMTDLQKEATELLQQLALDRLQRSMPSSRWSTKWSTSNDAGPNTKRVLYQCDCGYDHSLTGATKRHNPSPYTSCIAHIEVTSVRGSTSEQILRIRGVAQHNDECSASVFTRVPSFPLHPEVYREAVELLKTGSPLYEVKKANRAKIISRSYPGIRQPPERWTHRYLIGPNDSRALYRMLDRSQGIDTRKRAHLNIHSWLDPTSPNYDPEIAAAVFHYAARMQKEDRLEVCIATVTMLILAWKYGHLRQIIMDGTFNLCNSKILVFCVMAINEEGRGVLLAMLLFSAPSGNNATAAGYDWSILAKLLGKWCEAVGAQRPGQVFKPTTCITDTDLKERIALTKVFPDIILLLCTVHLMRSWRNYCNGCLRGGSSNSETIQVVTRRLRDLEKVLIATTVLDEAKKLVITEFAVLKRDVEDASVQQGALKHLLYLWSYWLQDALWASWAEGGRQTAAKALKCNVKAVIKTTNHLKAFNRVLKRNRIAQQQQNGRLLRPDRLIRFAITDVFPSMTEDHQLKASEKERHQNFVLSLAGSAQLWEASQHSKQLQSFDFNEPPSAAFLSPDTERDAAASTLIDMSLVGSPVSIGENLDSFVFECYSSVTLEHDTNPTIYNIQISTNGMASCSCPNFSTGHGRACKHLRACLISLNRILANAARPLVSLPPTLLAAQELLNLLSASATPATADPSPNPAQVHPIHTALAAHKLGSLIGAEAVEAADVSQADPRGAGIDEDEDDAEVSPELVQMQLQDEGVAENARLMEAKAEMHAYSANMVSNASPNGSPSTHHGVSQQMLTHVSVQSEAVGIKLDSLEQLLDETGTALAQEPRAAMSPLLSLQERLARILGKVESITGVSTAISASPTEKQTQKRPFRMLQSDGSSSSLQLPIAPSPEKKQRRQDSYSIH